MLIVIILLGLALFPVLALAQAVAAVSAPLAAPSLLSSLLTYLPVILALGGPYVTHVLQGYTKKIPAAWQPILSSFSGIVIAVLGGAAMGSTISPDVLALLGGVSGGTGHGLIQSTPIAPPTQNPTPAA